MHFDCGMINHQPENLCWGRGRPRGMVDEYIQAFVDQKIAERVREARIDEVTKINADIHPNFDQSDKLMSRLAALSKEQLPNVP